MPWEEITATKAATWNFKTDKVLEGVYTKFEENVGENNSNLYTFEKKDGSKVGVWGNSFLDARLPNVQVGEELKIEYTGMETNTKTGRKFHSFKISRFVA